MPGILHAIQIAAPPDTNFPLVSSANGFSQWWAEDSVAAGEAAELGFFNRATLNRLRPQVVQPPSPAMRRPFSSSAMPVGARPPTSSLPATRLGAH